MTEQTEQPNLQTPDPFGTDASDSDKGTFGFTLDDLRADAVDTVNNPILQAAIRRVKQGQTEDGFYHAFDKAYHSHSRT